MAETATPPYSDTPPPEQQGPTSWAAAAAPAAAAPAAPAAAAPSPDEARLAAFKQQAQNADTSKAPSTSAAPSNPQIPQVSSAETGPPLVMRPKRAGMLGVVDKIADALTGVTHPELYTDQHGNEYVYHPNLSRGQQWARIGATVARGAAAGYAAGQGVGGQGRAALAGIQMSDKANEEAKANEQTMETKVRQEMLDKANMQMQQMKMAEMAWTAAQQGLKATRDDIDFNNKEIDRAVKEFGASYVGSAKDPNDIAGILHVEPQVMSHMIENHTLQIYPQINPKTGAHEGIQAYKLPAKYGTEMLPPGALGSKYDPDQQKIVDFNYSDPVSQFQVETDKKKAHTDQLEDQTKRADLEAKQQQIEKDKFGLTKEQQMLPLDIKEKQANTDRARAEADASRQKTPLEVQELQAKISAAKEYTLPLKPDGSVDLSQVPPTNITTARQIAVGDQKLTDMVGRGGPAVRQYWMQLTEAIDPSFTEQKFDNRLKVSNSFADGEDADSITSFNQFASHAGAVSDGVNAMRNGRSPWLNTPLNKIATKGRGDTEITQQLAPINASRTEFFNFLNNDHALQSSDKEDARNQLNENMRPAQMQASVRSMLGTAADRFIEKNNKYKRTFGRNFPDIMTAQTARILREHGYGDKVDQLSVAGEPEKTTPSPAAAAPAPAPAPGGPAPQTHNWSKSGWLQTHPGGDVNAAAAEAQRQKFTVVN